MKQERIKEGWHSFIRIYCKEGFIDKWSGDMSDDPNREQKNTLHLNATHTFFRLNGIGKWEPSNDFHKLEDWIRVFSETEIASEIWEMA